MEDRAVVKALVHVAQEVLRRDRGRLLVHFDAEVAEGGLETNHGVFSGHGADSTGYRGARALRHALVPGEVGPGRHGGESRGCEKRAHRGALARAVLDDEAARRLEMPGRRGDDGRDRRESVRARDQGAPRLMRQRGKRRVGRRDVGRIRGDRVEAGAGEAARTRSPRRSAGYATRAARHCASPPRALRRSHPSPSRRRPGARGRWRARSRRCPCRDRGPRAARGRAIAASAHSTTSSVSGRGTSTSGVTSRSSDQNSRRPVR